MHLELLFPIPAEWKSRNSRPERYPDFKPWVIKAIAEEEQKPEDQLWRGEPTAEFRFDERLRRIRFLHKRENSNSSVKKLADRLELCMRNNRCCSGACPECGRLLQRWFVRNSKNVIRNEIEKPDQQLVAITIIPSQPIIRLCRLHSLSISNMQRRLKCVLDKADIGIVLGGIDFSFNEDKQGIYKPFWCVHCYLITSINDRAKISRLLKQSFKSDRRIPRPIKLSDFNNSARRRSYAFKIQFKRRIGLEKQKKQKTGTTRNCRNTSKDKLRATERLELFTYLDRIGLAGRFVFRRVKPVIARRSVIIQKI